MSIPTTEERQYRVALSLVPRIGITWFKKLVAHFGSAKAVFEAAYQGDPVLPSTIAQRIVKNNSLQRAETLLRTYEEAGIQCITADDTAYPKRLLEIPDNPPIVYYKGTESLNKQRIVSIIGTRQLTPYGKDAIAQFVAQLLPYNPLIVSGLAYGADIWAHKQALVQGLGTVAVLPTSLEEIYPPAHAKIAMQLMASGGGVLTEYPVGSGLGPYAFVARNRIVAGLADATIVIEAKEKSGALITAYYANSYHREVFALPGPICAATSAGCHQLIKRNHAHLLTHIDDLVYLMNWSLHPMHKSTMEQALYAPYQLTLSEQTILNQFEKETDPIAVDVLLHATQLPPSQLQASLLSLELQGLLRTLPGKRFALTNRRQR